MKKIVINGKEHASVPFDFNTVCDMEDMGFSIQELSNKQFKALRAYFALCAKIPVKQAGKEIEQHVIGGGNLADLAEVMGKEMEASDFFRTLQQRAEAETREDQQTEEPQEVKTAAKE